MQRQQADCRRLAESKGFSLVEVFTDNDLSTCSGKPRPGYRRLLNALRGGELDAVVAWHADRLHRSPVELEEFIAVCDERRIMVETVQAGTVDLSTPSGRMVARMLGSGARYESEHKAERIKRKARELAEAGKVGGGGTRPFGYESDRRTLRESEAAVIRDLAARFLAGESLGSLTRWLNDRGVPSVSGRGWSIQTVRRLLLSGRISGQREHHGQIVAPAEWRAIITPEQTARIRAVLADPARRTTRTARRYLLAGMLRCHRCGTTMVARPREDRSRRYVCPGPPHPRGSGGTFVLADPVEQWLIEAVLYRLDSPHLADAVAGRASGDDTGEAAQQQIERARTRLTDLAEMFGTGEITRAEYVTARKAAEDQIKTAEKTLGALTRTSVLDGHLGQGAALRKQWDSLNLDRKRAIVRTVLDYATVGPAVRGRNTFDPSRITPEWRL
jgi:site-specific DNA recombinase